MFKKVQVVMLPTNEKANLAFNKITNKLGLYNRFIECTTDFKPQHLYILSSDEIKEGDWVYNPIHNTIYQWIKNAHIKFDRIDAKKIIATTDISIACVKDILSVKQRKGLINHYPTEKWILPQPSQQFIEKYIEEYNKSNQITQVVVEYEEYAEGSYGLSDGEPLILERLKVNPKDNTITIRKIKDNWNREELTTIIHKYRTEMGIHGNCNDKDCDKWIEKNL